MKSVSNLADAGEPAHIIERLGLISLQYFYTLRSAHFICKLPLRTFNTIGDISLKRLF